MVMVLDQDGLEGQASEMQLWPRSGDGISYAPNPIRPAGVVIVVADETWSAVFEVVDRGAKVAPSRSRAIARSAARRQFAAGVGLLVMRRARSKAGAIRMSMTRVSRCSKAGWT